LEKVTQTVLTYPIKSLKQKEDPTVWNTAIYLNPLNRFTNTDSHKYNNKLLSDFITLASIFYACYSAWYTNPTSQLSSVAETLFLQICIRYALHVAALPRVPKEKVKKFLGIGNKNEGVD
jgi:hypothetical protein